MAVHAMTKKLVKEVMGESKMQVGKVVTHPDGRKVKITEGQEWGEHGYSNFWSWKEVKKDGTLGKEESGYGW
jgi:hypothetical protein